MKWKTGAALMVVVLLIAMIPAAVSALKTGGLPSFAPKPDSHQLVLQIDNSAALKDGEVVNLDDGKGNAITPYIDESGNMLVPIRPLVEGLGGSLVFEDETFKITMGSKTVELGQDAYSIEGVDGESHTLPVKPTRNGNSFYVPGRAVTEALGGQIAYYPPAEGGYVICAIGDVAEGDMDALKATAQEKLGYSVQQYLKDCLAVRDGSSSVMLNGDTVQLESNDKVKKEEDGLYFPAESLSEISSGSLKYADGAVTKDGSRLDLAVKTIDDTPYVKMSDLASALGKNYCEPADGMAVLTGYVLDGHKMQMDAIAAQASGLPSLGNIPQADAYIALTFDDGPTGGSSGLTVKLLDALKEHNAHATFFMCGYRIKDFHTHMDRYLGEGHEVGNHTMNHPMKTLKGQSSSFVHEEVDSNTDLIESYVGQKPTVMRPVGGAYDDNVKECMKESGLPIINWSLDTLDWKNRDADIIYQKIVDNAQDGDIVLMHDLRQCTVDGVSRAMDTLADRGFAFVTVSELAAIKGVTMEPGEVYTDFRDETVAKLKGTSTTSEEA
ncbi:polysaccharide deacetylase family protein [Butyricicoccus pullicaecorum]|uniref:NodB homology domain-containing protein n=1 Tax=Butyricicoccus pullicaecorum 1.2 TaxID=1203606 RepID=R8W8D5_9FIRM|nr:polysaccharide deacetylase family protein [Butyricicoccus pullicaecorum]EOQ39417.1 hypothetical protein HMPREF1526_00111 [Butyricicoccus pullicaecorum 1.2]SKA56080.1 Peptidoglycan/xylan/chitin deacetylase, PgdA/CDA1 family [Butyricicoccus pullicaecorum DSM 23266]